MASNSKSIFVCLAFLMVFCFILMKETSDCNSSSGCLFADHEKVAGFSTEIHNRKVLGGVKEKKEVITGGNQAWKSAESSGNYKLNEWELRKVPSGPDPLHHNGNSPKPRTP